MSVEGFRIDAVISVEPAVYAATQLELDRAVALHLLPSFDPAAWPDAYAAGPTPDGRFFVATPPSQGVRSKHSQRRWRFAPALAVAAIVIVVLARGRDDHHAAVPAPLPGSIVLGSALHAGSITSTDCTGRPPDGNSEPCTLVQASLVGGVVSAPRAGTLRRWTVRGARGRVALQLIRRVGAGLSTVATTGLVTVADTGVHTFTTSLSVQPGDLLGLEVAPGAAVGLRHEVPGARTIRFTSPLRGDVRDPDPRQPSDTGAELQLRAELVQAASRR